MNILSSKPLFEVSGRVISSPLEAFRIQLASNGFCRCPVCFAHTPALQPRTVRPSSSTKQVGTEIKWLHPPSQGSKLMGPY